MVACIALVPVGIAGPERWFGHDAYWYKGIPRCADIPTAARLFQTHVFKCCAVGIIAWRGLFRA